jgi:hypothetical protein
MIIVFAIISLFYQSLAFAAIGNELLRRGWLASDIGYYKLYAAR